MIALVAAVNSYVFPSFTSESSLTPASSYLVDADTPFLLPATYTARHLFLSRNPARIIIAFAKMAGKRYLCPKCPQSFRREKKLRRHLSKVPHRYALICPFPIKSCKKVFADYGTMLKHLRNDVQVHKGLGLGEIHKLVASLHADKEAIAKLKPQQWVSNLFRSANGESKGNEGANRKTSRAKKSKKPKKNSAVAKEESEQVNNNHNNKPHGLVADEPMDDEEEYGGYESEPEEWWMR
ncbi:uncharacterized protein PG986_000558 [Apiospora aurea]|uniref:C2H2-type domain-containing protein n=1 Tax=Apiospora aurea TaxID=335848 RepID=A0ABR1QUC0_9PEZI